MNSTPPYDAATLDDVSNPYLAAAAPPAPPPDLDAGAPMLRNAEQQRINRKALLFLGGILLLLMMLAVLVFSNATRKKPADKASDEQVNVPTLADSTPPAMPPLPQSAASDPIEVQPTSQALSPPLPADSAPPAATTPYPAYPADSVSQARAQSPSLLERRMGVTDSAAAGAGTATVNGMTSDAYVQQQMAQMTQSGLIEPSAAAPSPDRRPAATAAQFLRRPDALLVRGTYLRCVLESRIVTDVAGFTSCILAEPVYSINGRTLLLPRGSKIYGSYNKIPNGDRVEVVWDRITTPTGIDVSMASPGIDNLGGAGHPGDRNSHWGSRITSALLVSLLSDLFKYEAAEHGPTTTTATAAGIVESPFESNTASTLDRLANQAAAQAMSRPPTVTINQGTVVTVYVAKDVDFSQVIGG